MVIEIIYLMFLSTVYTILYLLYETIDMIRIFCRSLMSQRSKLIIGIIMFKYMTILNTIEEEIVKTRRIINHKN